MTEEPKASTTEKPKEKTYKREIAAVQLLFLGVCHVWGVYNESAAQMAQFLTLPVFTFAGGAFALDAVAKQMSQR